MLKTLICLILVLACSAATPQNSAQTNSTPPSELPAAAKAVNEPISVRVEWDRILRRVDPLAYGVNCPDCLTSERINPAMLHALAEVTDGGKPLIRLSGWGLVTQGSPESWLNPDGTWNEEKIRAALSPLVRARYTLMINILAGPKGEKDPVGAKAMASFAASLVKIVNIDSHLGVHYWELPNEREHVLRAPQMAAMLSRAAAAMKAVDPTILVGGPAMESINIPYIATVVEKTSPSLDFITVHTYGGDGKQSDAVSYQRAIQAIRDVRALRERLQAISPNRYLPIFVDEYNIGWDSTPNIASNAGAVYFSILQSGVVEAGGDVSAVWDFSPSHDMSIVDHRAMLYPSAHLFTLMNRYFQGNEVSAETSDPDHIWVYAVASSQTHALLLSNLDNAPHQVILLSQAWHARNMHEYRIAAAGYQDPGRHRWSEFSRIGIQLPPESVTILVHP